MLITFHLLLYFLIVNITILQADTIFHHTLLFFSFQMQHISSPSSSLPSVWQGFWRKVRLLLPYVWPKGAAALQGLVLLCVGLLLAERLVNVLVPVYSKNIGMYQRELLWMLEWNVTLA